MQPNADQPPGRPFPANEGPPAGQPPTPRLRPVPPMIQHAQAAFRRDLPGLMKTHYLQWVAYHGDKRIGFSHSKTELVLECLRRGIPEDEFVVRGVEPEIPEESDHGLYEFDQVEDHDHGFYEVEDESELREI